MLERRGLIERDLEKAWPATDVVAGPLDDLIRHSITYRIAVGPRVGQWLFTLQTVPPRLPGLEGDADGAARAGGFSLHAGVDIAASEREKLERLCRYVSRPPVATERLALTASGQVRYTPKTPYRLRAPCPRLALCRISGHDAGGSGNAALRSGEVHVVSISTHMLSGETTMNRIRTTAWSLGLVAASGVMFAAAVEAKQPPPPAAPWVRYDNPGPVTGPDGKTYSATCSGVPGTDPTFRFWARKTDSRNLVVYFEGGGACWDNLTCSYPIGTGLPLQFYVPATSPLASPALVDGIFRQDNPANPVRDWNFVYIPYCTGDIHSGSATRTYFNAGNPNLPASYTIQHRGFDNFMVVLDWIRSNFDAPKNILVTGASAGGYGATFNFPHLADAYPNAHMFVLADASQGVTTPAFDAGTPGRGSWNSQFPSGVDPATPGEDVLRAMAERHPRAKVSQFTTAADGVQVGFYGVMKQFYGPGGSCPNAAVDWNNQMLGTLAEYDSQVPNFRYYLAAGTYHTLLRSTLFYTESSPGVVFADWLTAMLANRGGTGGAGGGAWRDVACPDCLTPLPCN